MRPVSHHFWIPAKEHMAIQSQFESTPTPAEFILELLKISWNRCVLKPKNLLDIHSMLLTNCSLVDGIMSSQPSLDTKMVSERRSPYANPLWTMVQDSVVLASWTAGALCSATLD
jgi:hypothetical protein